MGGRIGGFRRLWIAYRGNQNDWRYTVDIGVERKLVLEKEIMALED